MSPSPSDDIPAVTEQDVAIRIVESPDKPTSDWKDPRPAPKSKPDSNLELGLDGMPSAPADFGPYELLEEVARGGMGVVYKARQRGLDRVVALKMVLASLTGKGKMGARFIQEARSAAALDHPNVVPIYDTGEVDGRVYFTMAFVDGSDLRRYVDQQSGLSIPDALLLFAQIVAGVAHAHKIGIIHRDLKPANVLIDRDGRPRVTDFGLAKKTAGDMELTETGQLLGTPSYMAPEQARYAKDVGPAADVYSLGAILYYLLTGRPPFRGETVPDLLLKLVTEPPEPPSQINAACPPDLEAVCLKCLAKNPNDRYADAQALLEALAPIAETILPGSALRLSSFGSRVGTGSGTGSSWSTDVKLSVAGQSSSKLASHNGTGTQDEVVATPSGGTRPVVWLGTAATVFLATAIVVSAKPWAKKDAPTVAAATTTTTPTTPAVNTDTKNVAVAPKLIIADAPLKVSTTATPIPVTAGGDINLKVELMADAKKDGNGVSLLPSDRPLRLRLEADRDCKVLVLTIDPKGQIVQLFPNEFEPDAQLLANQPRFVPGDAVSKEVNLKPEPTEANGIEKLQILATTGDLPTLPKVAPKDGLFIYSSKEHQEEISKVRGIVLKKVNKANAANSQFAEAVLDYRVK